MGGGSLRINGGWSRKVKRRRAWRWVLGSSVIWEIVGVEGGGKVVVRMVRIVGSIGGSDNGVDIVDIDRRRWQK